MRGKYWGFLSPHTLPPPLSSHSRVVPLFSLISLPWLTVTTQSAEFALLFTLGIVHSTCLDKCIMTCIQVLSFYISVFFKKKGFTLFLDKFQNLSLIKYYDFLLKLRCYVMNISVFYVCKIIYFSYHPVVKHYFSLLAFSHLSLLSFHLLFPPPPHFPPSLLASFLPLTVSPGPSDFPTSPSPAVLKEVENWHWRCF